MLCLTSHGISTTAPFTDEEAEAYRESVIELTQWVGDKIGIQPRFDSRGCVCLPHCLTAWLLALTGEVAKGTGTQKRIMSRKTEMVAGKTYGKV